MEFFGAPPKPRHGAPQGMPVPYYCWMQDGAVHRSPTAPTGAQLERIEPDDVTVQLTNELVTKLHFDPDAWIQAQSDTTLNAILNRTNIHTHGWHVSPKSVVNPCGNVLEAHDDVLINILPPNDSMAEQLFGDNQNQPGVSQGQIVNQQLQYVYDVPSYHAPGTHWYHPHKDGAVAIQVQNGMAGALIIDEPAGQEIIQGVTEQVMVLQEINNVLQEQTDDKGQKHLTESGGGGTGTPGNQGVLFGKIPLVSTINGLYQPTIDMQPGEIQRWRIVNAGSNTSAFNKISVVDSSTKELKPFYVVAYDGVTLSQAQWAKQLQAGGYKSLAAPAAPPPSNPPFPTEQQHEVFVAAGNRVDILFQAPSTPNQTYDITVNAAGLYFGTPGYGNTPPQTNPYATPLLPLFKKGYTQHEGTPTNEGAPPAFETNGGQVVNRPVFIFQIPPGYINKVPWGQLSTVIGHVNVTDSPINNQQIPQTLPAQQISAPYLKPIQDNEINGTKKLVFDVSFPASSTTVVPGTNQNSIETDDSQHTVTINGTVFDANVIQVQVGNQNQSNTDQQTSYGVEEWTIVNNSDQSHPFHIHVNPFQVVEVGQLYLNQNGALVQGAQPTQNPKTDGTPFIQVASGVTLNDAAVVA